MKETEGPNDLRNDMHEGDIGQALLFCILFDAACLGACALYFWI